MRNAAEAEFVGMNRLVDECVAEGELPTISVSPMSTAPMTHFFAFPNSYSSVNDLRLPVCNIFRGSLKANPSILGQGVLHLQLLVIHFNFTKI